MEYVHARVLLQSTRTICCYCCCMQQRTHIIGDIAEAPSTSAGAAAFDINCAVCTLAVGCDDSWGLLQLLLPLQVGRCTKEECVRPACSEQQQ
jgi:hypothetical protein